jgi:type III secretion system YscQ/HrcQ family protein
LRGAPRKDTQTLGLARKPPPAPQASRADHSIYTRQSRAYEPSDPELKKKRPRPFRLTELQRIPKEHRDLHRALHTIMPEAMFAPGFLRRIRDVLQKHTDIDIDLWMDTIRTVRRDQLRAIIPGTTFLAIIGLPPFAEKLVVEVDLRFVYAAINKLLGGHGISVDMHRPLTEIEQGVFSYLLLKVLMLFQEEVAAVEQVAVRLEDMRSDVRSAADIFRTEDFWLAVTWKMNFDLDVGYVRVLLPTSLARRVVPKHPPKGSQLEAQMFQRIRRRMGRLGGAPVEARVEAGRIELTREDLSALDPGDIILLDHTQVKLRPDGAVTGRAHMTVGLGSRGVIHGDVGVQRGQIVFEIKQIEAVEIPQEHDPQLVSGEPGNPEEVMAEYEERPEGEADDGSSSADEELDEDFGIDDENEGDDEQYEYDEEGEQYDEEQAYEDEQGYDQENGEASGQSEEIPIDDDDNLSEAEPLLGDIPIAVVVELGRVQLTADEVIRLRAGQLIELGRSPADPVDLVVNGKLLAKGELVEIEGALGVKLLNLVKEHPE